MKTTIKQTALLKKANKALVWGTVLKILLPGTGIGTLVSTTGWVMAMDDVYHNPEAYPILDSDSYRRLAGKLPKELEQATAESQRNLDNEIDKLVKEMRAQVDKMQFKKNEGESQ